MKIKFGRELHLMYVYSRQNISYVLFLLIGPGALKIIEDIGTTKTNIF